MKNLRKLIEKVEALETELENLIIGYARSEVDFEATNIARTRLIAEIDQARGEVAKYLYDYYRDWLEYLSPHTTNMIARFLGEATRDEANADQLWQTIDGLFSVVGYRLLATDQAVFNRLIADEEGVQMRYGWLPHTHPTGQFPSITPEG